MSPTTPVTGPNRVAHLGLPPLGVRLRPGQHGLRPGADITADGLSDHRPDFTANCNAAGDPDPNPNSIDKLLHR